jgi:hypothetical protein
VVALCLASRHLLGHAVLERDVLQVLQLQADLQARGRKGVCAFVLTGTSGLDEAQGWRPPRALPPVSATSPHDATRQNNNPWMLPTVIMNSGTVFMQSCSERGAMCSDVIPAMSLASCRQ